MKKRKLSAPLFGSLLWVVPGAIVLSPVRAQEAAAPAMPTTAYVLAVRGTMITLSAGSDMGARVGAIYQIARDNRLVRLQLVEVRPAESSARIVAADTGDQGLTITVGDAATLVVPATPVQPVAPTEPVVPVEPVEPIVPVEPTAPTVLPPAPPSVEAPPIDGETPPQTVLVTQVEGQNIMLGAGTGAGMKLGAVYAMPATGTAKMSLIVVEVGDDSARARVLDGANDFVPVVGENARFVGLQTIPAELLAPNAPVVVTPTQPQIVVPDSQATPPDSRPSMMQVSEISGRAASIIAVNGPTVTLGAGAAQGASVGQNVPILRGGAVIALVRIESVESDTATASVVYSDAAAGALQIGDAAGLIAPSSGLQAPVTIPAIGLPGAPVPSVRVRFESGASNIVVPKADATYELLASLAARGLIKSQPARVFQDDGARRHRTAEDITFSQAQVAGFIAEALSNFDGEKGTESAALSILVKQYRRDLQSLNVPAETLDAFKDNGFQLGISSWTRLTLAGGDNGDDSRDAQDERFGAFRRKSGLDTRTNVFGTIAPKLSFYASVDAGTGVRNGEPFGQIAGNSLRKAYIDYDAGSLLRGLTMRLGRQEFWWGPGHFGTGVLGDAAGGLDSFTTSFRRGSYELRGLYANLGHGPAGSPRSLYGQDVNVRLGKSAKIGINTTVLSPSESFNLRNFVTSFTPYPLYTSRKDRTTATSTNVNSNAVVSAYGEASLARGVRVYGETILDDLAINEKNPIENRAGSLFGIKLNDPKDPARAGLNFEYARFASVFYTYFANRPSFDDDYSYYYRSAPLGYPIAPVQPTFYGGAENLRLEGYYRPLRKLTLFGGLQYSDINSQDQDVPGDPGFQRQRVVRAAAVYDLSSRFTLTARYQRTATDHPDFREQGPTRKDSIFSLEIGRSF